MRKKIALILSLLLTVIMFSSCGTTQTEFLAQIKGLNDWEAKSINLNGTLEVAISGIVSSSQVVADVGANVSMDMSMTGYVNNKDNQIYLELIMSDKAKTVTIPTMKMFIDKTDIYINKEYIIASYSQYGSQVPEELQSLDAEYICIPQIMDSGIIENQSYAKLAYIVYEEVVTKLGIDLPMTKQDNVYTMIMDENIISDQILKVSDNAITNLESLNDMISLELTQEDIAYIRQMYNKEELTKSLEEFKSMAKGSELKLVFDFKDDKTVNQDITFNIPVIVPIDETQSMTMTFKANITSQTIKDEVKSLELPKNSVKLTAEQIGELNYTTDSI